MSQEQSNDSVKTALVIGGTGLVGRHVVSQLVGLGIDTYALGRSPKAVPEGATFLASDLGRPSWTNVLGEIDQPVDALIYATFSASGQADLDERINSLAFLEALTLVSAKKVVFLSSVLVYGTNPTNGGTLDETSAKQPDTLYQQSKVKVVDYLRTVDGGYSSTVLHLSHVWDKPCPGLNHYRDLLSQGYVANEATLRGTYNIVHASDAARAVILSITGKSHEPFREFIVSGESLVYEEYLRLLETSFGLRRTLKVPKALAPLTRGPVRRILSKLSLRPPIIIQEPKASWLANPTLFSSEKIRRDLGWRPLERLKNLGPY